MNKVLYHGTSFDKYLSILDDEKILPGCDGVVYCCESIGDVLKFMYFRPIDVVCIIPIVISDNTEVEETFDHSYQFFKCRCYGIRGKVSLDNTDIDNSIFIDMSKVHELLRND